MSDERHIVVPCMRVEQFMDDCQEPHSEAVVEAVDNQICDLKAPDGQRMVAKEEAVLCNITPKETKADYSASYQFSCSSTKHLPALM